MEAKNTMQVTDGLPTSNIAPRRMTDEMMQRDLSYRFAQKFAEDMFNKGLISQGEFDRLSILNREKFSPYLSEILA